VTGHTFLSLVSGVVSRVTRKGRLSKAWLVLLMRSQKLQLSCMALE